MIRVKDVPFVAMTLTFSNTASDYRSIGLTE